MVGRRGLKDTKDSGCLGGGPGGRRLKDAKASGCLGEGPAC